MKLSPKQLEATRLIAEGRFYPCFAKEEDGWHARWRAIGVENDWVDEYVRQAAMTRLSEDAEDQRHETLHDAWLMALKSRTGLVVWNEAECAAFAEELKDWSGNAQEDVEARASIIFRFEPGAETFRISCACPRGRRALTALGQAAYLCGVLRGLQPASRGEALEVFVGRADAEAFLGHEARDLRHAGYGIEGVDLAAPISASATCEVPESADADADPAFKLTVKVDGESVTLEEIRFLLEQGSSLVFFRDRWIEVDRGILKEALRALEKGLGRRTNALAFALGLGHIGRLELEEVQAHGWLRGLVNELRAQGRLAEAQEKQVPRGLKGTLRPYQARGVEWLRFLTGHGFGALLADDMGLGKTVQTIAWMLSVRKPGSPMLIVAPLTLLANWKHEFAAFAPGLRVYVHQGEGRHLASGFRRAVAQAEVTLTSYNLLVRDYSLFSEIAWDALVLDEAQTIKNPDTQVARAVRALTPAKRVALSGTPIENSVEDLWSIEEFLNPGFLGERKSFIDRFAKPIAVDGQSAAGRRLRHALEPFVLRRLKTDPRIAAELGAKREVREYCPLTPAQRLAYENALADFRGRAHTQGDIFALLTELKLICDGESKFERLCTLLEQIFDAGESALVFTQYAKVGAEIREGLEKRFGVRVPFLHGALSATAREAEVERFRRTSMKGHPGSNVFILSLKAGGFGLNLTKATHVIHFDRWWNPAVENQATDRAHRIGQARTVFVHLFISEGTIEERVDEILRRKSAQAETVITAAEWLEMLKEGAE